MAMLRRLILLLALLLAPTWAQARGIDPELVAEGPAVPGGEVELAIVMRTKPGWHGYWLNPGDAGLPMDVKWSLPAGYSVGTFHYPVPGRLLIGGIMNYVYEHDYAVLARLKVPAGASGIVPIRASATWLACTDKICVPESGELALDLAVGTGASKRAQFDQWRRALPRPLATQARFEERNGKVRIAVPLPASVAVDDPYFFPAEDGVADYAGVQVFRRDGDTLIAELPGGGRTPPRISGVLAIGEGDGLELTAVPGPVPQGGAPVGALGDNALLWAVLGAILGGILLNLMPCVFPILALKALHLARSGGDAGHARRDALAYAGGAILGTGALGLALLAIRAGGNAAGWAFQLQDPRSIMLLLLLATAITANLVGLFQLPTVGGGTRPAGSFGTGALAAFVATPCAGPFLGAALGTALLLPLYGSVLVFAALGLGLALPFLAVAFIPALRRKLPAPGPWMQRLQRFLAIPMAATAIGAIWLLYREAGMTGLWIGIAAAAVLLAALVLVGRGQRSGGALIWLGTGVAALAVAGAIAVAPQRNEAALAKIEGAEPWSEAAVQKVLASGRPAFVYFTADWCLTCKVNEAAAIDRDSVRAAFDQSGVQVFAADWTNGDPAITRFLEGRGRAGVPLYLWYAPGKPPEELPQVLTPAMLTSRARAPRWRAAPRPFGPRPRFRRPGSGRAPAHRPASDRGRR
ncbi:thioredoxin family protein [Sphingomonas sabuli]|uniref:Thioredoxin family protein n=1 Tax=Sphingomonas sabuli TaxID=2764186 RepID=A0A7G9L1T3_9SPHN|nr:protein-disulfide reductase DsbD domain-containing protein [Sphingomonas sabuli]QNM82582.1 thioredoxin family protein [Sphingomonas sabuli]